MSSTQATGGFAQGLVAVFLVGMITWALIGIGQYLDARFVLEALP